MKQSATRAFTLIELLIVIGIIAVLAGIGLTVAPSLVNSGRAQATQSTMLALESVIQDLSVEADLRPKDYAHYKQVTSAGDPLTWFPVIDARVDGADFDRSVPAVASLGRLLLIAEETVPGVQSRWAQLDASIVRAGNIGNRDAAGNVIEDLAGTEVLDQWGNPIRFVHPSFDGGAGDWFEVTGDPGMSNGRPDFFEVPTGVAPDANMPRVAPDNVEYRRSYRPFDPTVEDANQPNRIGDADEGIVPGGTGGYLYSAGPDGDPGTRADNVYASVLPEYPAETRDDD